MLGGSVRSCLVLAVVVGCSDGDAVRHGDPTPPLSPYLGLTTPEPGEGFQVRSLGMPIPAGEDLEFCEVAEVPGDAGETYWVGSIEFANGKNSHHLVVQAAKEGSPAEAELAQRELGERIPCISVQAEFGEGFEYIGAAQSTYRVFEYPAGTGRRFRGKQRFVFDYHYFNTTDEELQARSALNFHLTKESQVEHIVQVFQFSNITIDTPPGGKASFTGECRMSTDLKLLELTRHTHRWGRDYEAWFAGGPRDGESIFTSPAYDQDVDHLFDAPVEIKAGEGFRYRCDYENTETYPLRYGANATDEMCSLLGLWFTESATDPPDQDCVMTQIEADGVARAKDVIKFPEPTPSQVAECLDDAATSDIARSPECTRCSCEQCAVVVDDCSDDEHCDAILDCVNRTGCNGGECLSSCLTEFNDHSPGTGLLARVGECVSVLCPVCDQ